MPKPKRAPVPTQVECLKTTGGGVKLQLVPRPGPLAESAAYTF